MSRYNQHSGSGTGSSNGEYDDTTIKLQKYAALNLTGDALKLYDGSEWGDKFIVNFEDVSVIDGIVMQRDDKPDTWKVFGFGDMGFNVGEDGLVYESYDAEAEEYTGQMSAEDVLGHARVQGFSETFGGDSYWYTPVGVVIEESGDVALNDDLDVDTIEVNSSHEDRETVPAIEVGDATMFLSNKSWVRTLAKLLSETGDDIIATETNEDGDEVAVTDSFDWYTVEESELRADLEGREMELFVIEESQTFDDEEVTYTTPILLDVKTGERITIDNDADDLEASDDGDTSASKTQSESDESTDEDDAEAEEDEAQPAVADGSGATSDAASGDVPDVLDDLLDYFARTQGEVEPDELREFAEDEVDDADDVDWEAAAAEVEERAD